MATLARWADEHPAAMRRLLEDAELRAQLAQALEDTDAEPAPADALSPPSPPSPNAAEARNGAG